MHSYAFLPDEFLDCRGYSLVFVLFMVRRVKLLVHHHFSVVSCTETIVSYHTVKGSWRRGFFHLETFPASSGDQVLVPFLMSLIPSIIRCLSPGSLKLRDNYFHHCWGHGYFKIPLLLEGQVFNVSFEDWEMWEQKVK